MSQFLSDNIQYYVIGTRISAKCRLAWCIPRCIYAGDTSLHENVWPSVKRVNCDDSKETSAKIILPYKTSIQLVLPHEKSLVKTTARSWNFGPNSPRLIENADFQSIFARSASAVTSRVHYALSNAFRALSSPQRGSKTQNCRFLSKSAIHLKKVC